MADDRSQDLLPVDPVLPASRTLDNVSGEFDETAYLAAFPDVAEAISGGVCQSPWQHYMEHGQRESRLLSDSYLQALKGRQLEGHVDFYGFSRLAKGWIFAGWTQEPWSSNQRSSIVACFQNGNIAGEFITIFYNRPGLQGRSRGFIIFVRSGQEAFGRAASIIARVDGATLSLPISAEAYQMPDEEIASAVRSILATDVDADLADELLTLLSTRGYGRLRRSFNTLDGFIDSYGHHSASGGWYFVGWVTRSWDHEVGPEKLIVHFTDSEIASTEAVAGFYPREDVEGRGLGFVIFVPATGRALGSLASVEVKADNVSSLIRAASVTQRVRDADLPGRLKSIIAQISYPPTGDLLASLLSRIPYSGVDTLRGLPDRVLLEFDEVITCPPGGIVMMGWLLSRPGTIRSIRLRSSEISEPVDFTQSVQISRPDVISSVGAEHGFDDPRCGFLVYVPCNLTRDDPLYLEIETEGRHVGYKNIPESRLEGLPAIRKILDVFQARYNEIPRAFDRTVGPPVDLLNRKRLTAKPRADEVTFGPVNPSPLVSVIIPLYGRLDFIEYQMAFMSGHPLARDYEFIMVLDDPPKQQEALRLFASVYARYGIPFRALLMEQNVGFAPANNAGLRASRGDYICFMNSDVFPETADWLEQLIHRLERHPKLGAVGPLLLYGDGSVQHEGMTFKTLPEFGNWQFGDHPRKGMRRSSHKGLRKHISITGACMVMRRELAHELGGFDEAFIIGDFEDSDLCLKLDARGLDSAVDLDVVLYHVERQSQASSARNWRMNLTLYNAWVHERRWGEVIASHPLRSAGSLLERLDSQEAAS